MSLPLKRLFAVSAVVAGLALSADPVGAQGDPANVVVTPAGQTVLGDVVPVGDGTGRAWVQLDGAGTPVAAGLTLTEAAMSGLATNLTPGLVWMAEYIVAFPTDVAAFPFDHVGLNWNPKGHTPGGIYDTPHFDVHFYMISVDDRTRITARGDDLQKVRRVPATGALPAEYVFAPESEEPGMGGHWVNPASHEFHGQPFTATFIYGTYDGQVIFYEPMITKAFLETKPSATTPLKVPERYARAGYYPTSYSVRYDAKRKEYTIALEGLTMRRAS